MCTLAYKMSVSGTMIMLPKNGLQPPIRRRRRVKYGLTPPLQHFRRHPRLGLDSKVLTKATGATKATEATEATKATKATEDSNLTDTPKNQEPSSPKEYLKPNLPTKTTPIYIKWIRKIEDQNRPLETVPYVPYIDFGPLATATKNTVPPTTKQYNKTWQLVNRI